jgi:hypothetical protein
MGRATHASRPRRGRAAPAANPGLDSRWTYCPVARGERPRRRRNLQDEGALEHVRTGNCFLFRLWYCQQSRRPILFFLWITGSGRAGPRLCATIFQRPGPAIVGHAAAAVRDRLGFVRWRDRDRGRVAVALGASERRLRIHDFLITHRWCPRLAHGSRRRSGRVRLAAASRRRIVQTAMARADCDGRSSGHQHFRWMGDYRSPAERIRRSKYHCRIRTLPVHRRRRRYVGGRDSPLSCSSPASRVTALMSRPGSEPGPGGADDPEDRRGGCTMGEWGSPRAR